MTEPEIVFLIRTDPRTNHRACEGLRIALSFAAGDIPTCIIFLEAAVHLLALDSDIPACGDMIEKYLPVFKDLHTPFFVAQEAISAIEMDPELCITLVSNSQVSDLIASAKRHFVF